MKKSTPNRKKNTSPAGANDKHFWNIVSTLLYILFFPLKVHFYLLGAAIWCAITACAIISAAINTVLWRSLTLFGKFFFCATSHTKHDYQSLCACSYSILGFEQKKVAVPIQWNSAIAIAPTHFDWFTLKGAKKKKLLCDWNYIELIWMSFCWDSNRMFYFVFITSNLIAILFSDEHLDYLRSKFV